MKSADNNTVISCCFAMVKHLLMRSRYVRNVMADTVYATELDRVLMKTCRCADGAATLHGGGGSYACLRSGVLLSSPRLARWEPPRGAPCQVRGSSLRQG